VSQEKTEQPSWWKLLMARRRGEVPNSKDVNSAAAFAAALAYLMLQIGTIARDLQNVFHLVLRNVWLAGKPDAPHTSDIILELGIVIARVCTPVLAVACVGAIAGGLIQTRGMVSFEPIRLNLQRVNPVSGTMNLFSVRNLLQLLKLLFGLLVVCIVVAVMIRDMLPDMIRTGYAPAKQTVVLSWYFVSKLVMAGLVVAALMATADYLISHWTFMRDMRMSKDEVKQEQKNLDGDPLIKSRQKGFFRELLDATTQQQIEQSKVLIVNPTHVAIAIRYQPGKIELPMVAAKGLDDRALAMRKYAERVGVPIYENRKLARELYRSCRPKDYIAHHHFEAVAEVFKWLSKNEGARKMAARAAGAGGKQA
jgi:type III secretion protein U